MRNALLAAGLALAVCVCGPGLRSESQASPDQPGSDHSPQVQVRKKVAHPSKPGWDQCYDMSVNRGFNHGRREWHQSILDCMDGKIPL